MSTVIERRHQSVHGIIETTETGEGHIEIPVLLEKVRHVCKHLFPVIAVFQDMVPGYEVEFHLGMK